MTCRFARRHDDANAWAVSRRFTVNQALRVLEVRNEHGLDSITQRFIQPTHLSQRDSDVAYQTRGDVDIELPDAINVACV